MSERATHPIRTEPVIDRGAPVTGGQLPVGSLLDGFWHAPNTFGQYAERARCERDGPVPAGMDPLVDMPKGGDHRHSRR